MCKIGVVCMACPFSPPSANARSARRIEATNGEQVAWIFGFRIFGFVCGKLPGKGKSLLTIHEPIGGPGRMYWTRFRNSAFPVDSGAQSYERRPSKAVPAQKSIRSRNLFADNVARPGFLPGPARIATHSPQAILPIGLPAAGGRRIGRWTWHRAAQPAGRAHAGGRPRRLVGLEGLRLLELILGRSDLQLVGSVVLALHDLEGGGRDGHMLGPEAKETAHAYNDRVDLPALVE